MRILLNSLGANMGGTVRHLRGFLPALERHDSENEYLLLIRDSLPNFGSYENIDIVRIPKSVASGTVSRFFLDNLAIPGFAKLSSVDAIVSLVNFGPLYSPVPHIVFQRNALYFFDDYDRVQYSRRQQLEHTARRKLCVEIVKSADVAVTPTGAMAERMKDTCSGVRDERFRTLYHGFEATAYNAPLEDRFVRQLDRKAHTLLYPTHAKPHKGFEVLFESLAKLRTKRTDFQCCLTITRDDWPAGWDYLNDLVDQHEIDEFVSLIGRVPQDQMGALYETSDLMVYPSLCESFGFSMIEALQHQLPVVAAGTRVNREMCGDGALYYPPFDAERAAEQIDDALEPSQQRTLIEGGHRRVNELDWGWARYAREFLQIVDDAIRT